jgi:hypothetical protein
MTLERPPEGARSRSASGRALVALAFYVGFAAIVWWLHGPEPALSIDHVTYFRLADGVRNTTPDYWRMWNSVTGYAVLMAYLLPATGSHVASLKLLLAAMTVAYLAAFHLFMRLAGASPRQAILFSILSALFVTFGASIWGMTDFAASLNRTIAVPLFVVLVWFFFRAFDSPWRYATYPALILVSLLHLSALHVMLVFLAFELLDFAFRRRFALDRDLLAFGAALAVAGAIQLGYEATGIGSGGFVRHHVSAAIAPTPAAPASPATPAEAPKPLQLTAAEAWAIEREAFPWRNLPPSAATLAAIGLSFGVILALAAWGAARALRAGATALDRRMLLFAAAVVLAAYGLQVALWAVRGILPIYPVNFEEIRAINMLMIPAVYFTFRLYQDPPAPGPLAPGAARWAVVAAFVLQPIHVLRALPNEWRAALLEGAYGSGLLRRGDSPRELYARQFLRLREVGPRFHYDARGAIGWLERHMRKDESVMTNLNEVYGSHIEAVGVFLNIIHRDTRSLARAEWAGTLEAVDRALRSRDLERVKALARKLGATYAIVDWKVEDAVYQDAHYAIVRVR